MDPDETSSDDTKDSDLPEVDFSAAAAVSYKVARSAAGNVVLNTIDVIGEQPFSV